MLKRRGKSPPALQSPHFVAVFSATPSAGDTPATPPIKHILRSLVLEEVYHGRIEEVGSDFVNIEFYQNKA